jgi:cell wall-associated NlpC family hydrolase
MMRWLLVGILGCCLGAMVARAELESHAGLEAKARWLAGQGIPYARPWKPPGESKPWTMDCSNTVRWLHREHRGEVLPRTSSGQYDFFRQRGRLRRVPPDPARLVRTLRPGDLLFWEHTHRPQRKPPVTHVMMYLGRDRSGRMWMAGSQGKRGVGIHEFRPRQAMGGYNWFLWFRREGRFVGFARP